MSHQGTERFRTDLSAMENTRIPPEWSWTQYPKY